MPNFVALDQTTYEKSVTNFFYTLQYFSVQWGLPEPKFTNLGCHVQQGLIYQSAQFS